MKLIDGKRIRGPMGEVDSPVDSIPARNFVSALAMFRAIAGFELSTKPRRVWWQLSPGDKIRIKLRGGIE